MTSRSGMSIGRWAPAIGRPRKLSGFSVGRWALRSDSRVLFRKPSIIDRRNDSSLNLFNIAAFQNPISPQGRQALNRVKRHAWIAPRAAGIVNADWFVHLDLARH